MPSSLPHKVLFTRFTQFDVVFHSSRSTPKVICVHRRSSPPAPPCRLPSSSFVPDHKMYLATNDALLKHKIRWKRRRRPRFWDVEINHSWLCLNEFGRLRKSNLLKYLRAPTMLYLAVYYDQALSLLLQSPLFWQNLHPACRPFIIRKYSNSNFDLNLLSDYTYNRESNETRN